MMCSDKIPAFFSLRNDLRWAEEVTCRALQNSEPFSKIAAYWRLVIRTGTIRWLQFNLLACLLGAPGLAAAAELKPEAAAGFFRDVRITEKRMHTELQSGGTFLWADGLPEARRGSVQLQLQRGEVVSARLKTTDPTGEIRAPG